MKITKIRVTDTEGIEHEWEGTDGYVTVMDLRESGGSKQAPGRLFGREIAAHVTMPVEPQ